MTLHIVQLGNGTWTLEDEEGELHGQYRTSLDASRALQSERVTGYLIGLCIPGCLYDSIRGPFDTEAEALAAIPDELADYGNDNYIGEVFPVDMTREEFEAYCLS